MDPNLWFSGECHECSKNEKLDSISKICIKHCEDAGLIVSKEPDEQRICVVGDESGSNALIITLIVIGCVFVCAFISLIILRFIRPKKEKCLPSKDDVEYE